MRFTQFEPWAPIRRMQRNHDRLWTNHPAGTQEDAAEMNWIPAVDVTENDEQWALHAEIPGVDPTAIEITAEDGFLVIQGEKPSVASEDELNQRRTERVTGRFYRRFRLPEEASIEQISATGKNGVLTISIPKLPEKQPQRIEISAA